MDAHAEMSVRRRQFPVLGSGDLQIGRVLAQELARQGTGRQVPQVVRRGQQDIRERVRFVVETPIAESRGIAGRATALQRKVIGGRLRPRRNRRDFI